MDQSLSKATSRGLTEPGHGPSSGSQGLGLQYHEMSPYSFLYSFCCGSDSRPGYDNSQESPSRVIGAIGCPQASETQITILRALN